MSTWTPERIAEVTRLWDEGLTTAEIGKIVGVSVVGKAHRLGLPARPSPILRNGGGGKSLATPRPVAKVPVKPARQIVLSTSGACCKWPFGHPGESGFHFFGSAALLNKPYQMAYLPARPKGSQAPREERPVNAVRRTASAA